MGGCHTGAFTEIIKNKKYNNIKNGKVNHEKSLLEVVYWHLFVHL